MISPTPAEEAWSYLNELRSGRPTDAGAVRAMSRYIFRDDPDELAEYERLCDEGLAEMRAANAARRHADAGTVAAKGVAQ